MTILKLMAFDMKKKTWKIRVQKKANTTAS